MGSLVAASARALNARADSNRGPTGVVIRRASSGTKGRTFPLVNQDYLWGARSSPAPFDHRAG